MAEHEYTDADFKELNEKWVEVFARSESARVAAQEESARLKDEIECHNHNHDACLDMLDKSRARVAELESKLGLYGGQEGV